MTLATSALAEASISQQLTSSSSGKKAPPKRTTTAVSDQKLAPEPR